MSQLTGLLQRAHQGDAEAAQAAFSLLYGDLCKLARARLAGSRRRTMLDTGSLINETYLRLAGASSFQPRDRQSYLIYAARAMRSVIIDVVRAQCADRRGGSLQRVTLNTGLLENLPSAETEILRVHDVLDELALVDERLVRVVEMRYFAGLTENEIAEALGVTDRTVRRYWEKARLLLLAALT